MAPPFFSSQWRPREAVRSFSLGVDGLPRAFDQLQAGRLYGATIAHAFARQHLLGRLVFDALLQAPVTVIVTQPGDGVAALLSAAERCATLVEGASRIAAQTASGRLKILQFSRDAVSALADADEWALLDEFDVRRVDPGSFVLVLDAEQVFSWSRPRLASDQGMAWRLWLRRRGCASLLVFGSAGQVDGTVNPNYLDGCFAGLASLETQLGRFSWRVDYWHTPDGAMTSREFDLAYEVEHARFVARGGEFSHADGRVLLAPDQALVLATEGALDQVREPPLGWKIAADYDDLRARSVDAVAATLLLDFSTHDDFEPLARTVHAIRLGCGRGVKIVIRERRVALRYLQELLLLRLGADLVVPGSLAFSRLIANLALMRTQVFTREIDSDFHAAVSSALPSPGRGYLPVASFCRSGAASIENAARIELPCALIRFPLRRDLPHLDALTACHPTRAGDIYSADSQHLFLFLFACPDVDISAAIDRLFSKPLGELFDGEVRYTAADAIEIELRRLAEIGRAAGAADYSSALGGIAPAPGVAGSSIEPAATDALPASNGATASVRATFTRGELASFFPTGVTAAPPRQVVAHALPCKAELAESAR